MSIDDIIETLKKTGLKQTVVTIEKNKPVIRKFSAQFEPSISDSFNSGCANLTDYELFSLEDTLRLSEIYSTEYFLPDLLPMGILALVNNTQSNEGIWRYHITDIPENDEIKLDKRIKKIVIVEQTNKLDDVDSVNYFRNKAVTRNNTGNKTKDPAIPDIDIFEIADNYEYGLKGTVTHEVYKNAIPYWVIKEINSNHYPILRDDNHGYNLKRGIKMGDIFSAIMMNPSSNEKNGDNRIFQFADHNAIGYIKPFDPGLYDVKAVPKEDLHVGFVYRFEVFYTKGTKGHEFHCRPIELVSGEDAIDVNYKKVKQVILRKRQIFEYKSGVEYIVGINHIEVKGNKSMGIFFDAMHQKSTGIAFFHENDQAYVRQLKNGGLAKVRVTKINSNHNGGYVVLSDFMGLSS